MTASHLAFVLIFNVLKFIFSVEPPTVHTVNTFIEMPEGASLSDNDDKDKYDVNDPHRALDIDLDL